MLFGELPLSLLPRVIDVPPHIFFYPKVKISIIVILVSAEIPQSFVCAPFFTSSMDHKLFYLFIYFENKIHLFWQMLVLGQRPKLSLIFWIVTQDLWFRLCCQTNKIVHLAHWWIISSPQRDVIVELVLVWGENAGHRFFVWNRALAFFLVWLSYKAQM